MFWDTVSSNARFSLTLSEILQFPFTTWSTNFVAFIATNIFFITPFVFLAALSGIFTTLRKATNAQLIVVLWLLLSIGAQIMFTRNSSIRYLISYLPLVLIFASVFVIHLSTRLQRWSLGILLSIPLLCSFWQIFAPVGYILSLSKFTSLSPTEYVRGTTSGYGLEEVLRFINDHAASGEIHVAVAENSGNPESALQMYYQNSSKVMVLYMDHKLLGDAVDQYDCLDTGFPTYFISREDQQAGLNKFLVKIKSISNPYSTNTLGIYQLVSTCTGKVGKMRLVK